MESPKLLKWHDNGLYPNAFRDIDFQVEKLIKHKSAVLIIAGGIDEFFVFANSNISKEHMNSE